MVPFFNVFRATPSLNIRKRKESVGTPKPAYLYTYEMAEREVDNDGSAYPDKFIDVIKTVWILVLAIPKWYPFGSEIQRSLSHAL